MDFDSSSEVGKVVLELGYQTNASCYYQVFVNQGNYSTSCGEKFTFDAGLFYEGYANASANCQGISGSSVVLEQTGCEGHIGIAEIKVYSYFNNEPAFGKS